jgi:hypothetical protein
VPARGSPRSTVGKASQTTELDELNPWTGELTPLVTGFSGIKGIVWVPPRGDARAGSDAGRR